MCGIRVFVAQFTLAAPGNLGAVDLGADCANQRYVVEASVPIAAPSGLRCKHGKSALLAVAAATDQLVCTQQPYEFTVTELGGAHGLPRYLSLYAVVAGTVVTVSRVIP